MKEGIELPLLPGGSYDSNTLLDLWNDASVLFEEDVIVTEDSTSHPELLTRILDREEEIYPVLVAHFLIDDRSTESSFTDGRTRGTAAFWHGQFSTDMVNMRDYLPEAMPSAEVFQAALKEDDEWIRTMAAGVFGGFYEHSVPFLPDLAKLLEDNESCPVVLDVFCKLGRFAFEVFPDIIKVAVHDEDADIRSDAVETIRSMTAWNSLEGMSEHAKSSAIPLLLSLAATPGLPSVTAAHALVLLGHDTTSLMPILLKALSAVDPKTRETAAKSLGVVGPACGPSALAAIQDRAEDPDPSVREAITFALRRMCE